MKLKIFDINNTPKTVPKGKPYLHVSATGYFTINKAMADQLDLQEGQEVKVAQDETRPKDWYLVLQPKCKDGFAIRNKKPSGMIFNSSAIAGQIFKAVGFTGKSGRILIGAEPVQHEGLTLVPLITSSLNAKA